MALSVKNATGRGKINANGRIVIPADLRTRMDLKPGDSVVMTLENDILHVESYRASIRRLQKEMQKYKKPGILASDELIAERREEARREMEEGLA